MPSSLKDILRFIFALISNVLSSNGLTSKLLSTVIGKTTVIITSVGVTRVSFRGSRAQAFRFQLGLSIISSRQRSNSRSKSSKWLSIISPNERLLLIAIHYSLLQLCHVHRDIVLLGLLRLRHLLLRPTHDIPTLQANLLTLLH